MPESLVCKFCRQPIYETEMTLGYMDRPVWMKGRWRHVKGDEFHCVATLIDPNCEKPRCHICGVEAPPHQVICSACGMPPHAAMPMDYEQKRP